MKVKKPTFGAQEKLARYIEPEYRQGSKRAKVGAFMEVHDATRNGLSVNSLEIHTENQIAAIYANKLDKLRPVAISISTIDDYNEAARAVNVAVAIEPTTKRWVHTGPNGSEESYKHDPKLNNDSHCLVRFTRHFNESQAFRFAHRMARKPTYRLY